MDAQDTISFSSNDKLLNYSITNHFTLYTGNDEVISVDDFLKRKTECKKRVLTHSMENLDFTSDHFFIHFVVVNESTEKQRLMLETARPITNGVELTDVSTHNRLYSGDGIPFERKSVRTNRSVLPLEIGSNESVEYVLRLESDGEIISLPIVFWESDKFNESENIRQFGFGIFYGVFLFVIAIYITFFILLKDRLFLQYSIYVFFSGLLQFSLDGYLHKYLFTSGGYLTQHLIIIIAGVTVISALIYGANYLKLEGKIRKVLMFFAFLIFVIVLLSLTTGKLYELSYVLVNGMSLLAVLAILTIGIKVRRNRFVSPLFILGLSCLSVGAIIFILGNFNVIDAPELTQNSLKIGVLCEIICLSILMVGKYKQLEEETKKAQQQLLIELEEKNLLMSEVNVRLEQEVMNRTKEIEEKRKELKEKNQDFISSVQYAKRIQKAVLSNEQKFKSILPKSFITFRPKDIVSGDFYWIDSIAPTKKWPNGLIFYATVDCTGHGVPGAFMSIIGNHLLELGKTNNEVQSPGEMLDFLNNEVNLSLNSYYNDEEIRDGMDLAFCAIDSFNKRLYFSGAKNSALIIRGDEMIRLKGDREAIGFGGNKHRFTNQEVNIQPGDMVYTFSDGYIDQFGGDKGKKFMTKRLKELLLLSAPLSMEEQQKYIEEAFDNWKGDLEQVDDVVLIGVQIQ